MATITLTSNSNYSSLSVADGDTIELNGFQLTFDINPVAINVQVQTPGKAGTIILGVPATYDFVGWTFIAGTAALLTTVASGKSVGGDWTAGTAGNTHAIATNSGTINGNVTGGSNTGASGVNVNNGVINGNATGGSATNAAGVNNQSGTLNGNATGGSGSGACGVITNIGRITGSVTGGTASTAHGVSENRGRCDGTVTGGSGGSAAGVLVNNGTILGLVTGGVNNFCPGIGTHNGNAIGGLANVGVVVPVTTYRGSTLFTHGPNTIINIPTSITQVYTLFGSLNANSVVPSGTTVTDLSFGGGSAIIVIED